MKLGNKQVITVMKLGNKQVSPVMYTDLTNYRTLTTVTLAAHAHTEA